MKFQRLLLLLPVAQLLLSCGSQKKLPPDYADRYSDTTIKKTYKFPEFKIQKGDLLSINIYSLSTNPKADEPYNLPMAAQNPGFLVDVNGNIEYPRLGTIHVDGLTKIQLADEIKKKLTDPEPDLLTSPSVIIRFLNYKVTVLGQVGHEGVLNIPAEKVTILEAIGLAGGINDFGKKDEVRILRETPNEIEVGHVDLSSDSLFLSPYYNLQPNDVIIVQATKQKSKQADQNLAMQKIGFTLSLITTAALLYELFK